MIDCGDRYPGTLTFQINQRKAHFADPLHGQQSNCVSMWHLFLPITLTKNGTSKFRLEKWRLRPDRSAATANEASTSPLTWVVHSVRCSCALSVHACWHGCVRAWLGRCSPGTARPGAQRLHAPARSYTCAAPCDSSNNDARSLSPTRAVTRPHAGHGQFIVCPNGAGGAEGGVTACGTPEPSQNRHSEDFRGKPGRTWPCRQRVYSDCTPTRTAPALVARRPGAGSRVGRVLASSVIPLLRERSQETDEHALVPS